MKYTIDTLSNVMYTNFLLIGPYKTGKTESLATLHKLKNRKSVQGQKLYIYDFDEGCQPIIRLAKAGGWANELIIFRYNTNDKVEEKEHVHSSSQPIANFLTDLNSLYDKLTPQNTWRDDFIAEAPYAICGDSLTAFQSLIQDYILALNGKIRDSEMSGDTGTMYRKIREKVVEVIRSMRALPCFSVWTAHEQVVAETVKQPWAPKGAAPIAPKFTGQIKALPVAAGQLASTLGAEFGGVFYSRTKPETSEKNKYFWITRPDGSTIPGCGSRLKENLPTECPQDFNLVVDP